MLKIVLTGPESSGKTTLAVALSKQFNVPVVPEFARYYLASLGRTFVPADLATIYRGQIAWEKWYAQHTHQLLICDTDWTVLTIWRDHLPADTPLIPESPSTDTHYLLCAPDIPWEADPLREHPLDRERLFEAYQNLFIDKKLPYHIIKGTYKERMEKTFAIVHQLI